jgi:hypothetical protein
MSCITYLHNDPFDSGGTKFISGTTCNGSAASYNLAFEESVCMEAESPLVICDGLTIEGYCFLPSQWYTNIKLFECNYGQTKVGLPLTGWTLEHSGITYTGLTQYLGINAATWCNIPVQSPFVGASYIFNLTTISAGWELCNQISPINEYWDSFEVILTSFNNRNCVTFNECIIEYNATINYYLNGVLQTSVSEIIQFTEYLVSENPSCSPSYTMFNQIMMFIVDLIRPTPTPTITQTPTSTFGTTPTQTPTNTITPTPTSTFGTTPTQTPTNTGTPTNTTTPTTTTTRTPTPTPNPYCYTITTEQSAPGECFDCPGFFASTTDTIIEFFDGCSGSTISAPFDMNVIAHYSDSSTGTTYISGGTVGSVVIATSDIQCVAPPTCGEIASPTFDFLTISGGTINECCE